MSIYLSGGSLLTDIENGPSINDLGNVAFVAKNNGFETIFVGNGNSTPTDITNFQNSNRNFFGSVEINNLNQVVAHDFVGSPLTSGLRVWDGNNPGNFDLAIRSASVGFTFGDSSHIYNLALPFASINNNSEEVIAVVLDNAPSGGPDIFKLVKPNSSLPDLGSGVPTVEILGPGPGVFARPQIADNGSVVLRHDKLPGSPIVLYDQNLANPQIISSGFTSVGQSPRISDDGQAIAFYGEFPFSTQLGKGKGVFVSLNIAGAWQTIPIATDTILGNDVLDPWESFIDLDNDNKFDPTKDTNRYISQIELKA
jgi:hypothetical protein